MILTRFVFSVVLLSFVTLSAFSQIHIDWNESSLTKINDTGEYPRLISLQDGRLACVYEDKKGNCCLNFYNKKWDFLSKTNVFSVHNVLFDDLSAVITPANPEIVQLKSGRVLYACNYRPNKNCVYPFSIAVRYSDDNCKTWSPLTFVYFADVYSDNGCWEPKFLELPSGEIQLYFSDENQFRNSREQEIVVMRSFDGGVSWSHPVTASYCQGKRDGMAVPILFSDTIHVVIEDDKYGVHQPSFILSHINDSWSDPVLFDSKNRTCLVSDIFEKDVYAGAPYVVADIEENVFLSFQTNYNRPKDYKYVDMCVAIKPKGSIGFYIDSFPFQTPLNNGACWSSLSIINKNTIVALTSSDVSGVRAPYLIVGKIIKY